MPLWFLLESRGTFVIPRKARATAGTRIMDPEMHFPRPSKKPGGSIYHPSSIQRFAIHHPSISFISIHWILGRYLLRTCNGIEPSILLPSTEYSVDRAGFRRAVRRPGPCGALRPSHVHQGRALDQKVHGSLRLLADRILSSVPWELSSVDARG